MLSEFLEVMQPPSKGKIWANEDAVGGGAIRIPDAIRPVQSQEDAASEDEYEHVPKKRKKSPNVFPQFEKIIEPASSTSMLRDVKERDLDEITTTSAAIDTDKDRLPEAAIGGPSDASWLRSRTSRLLGLVDDDDGAVTPASETPKDVEKTNEAIDGQTPDNATHMSDTGSQTNEVQNQDIPESKDILDSTLADSLASGRLFVRNLSYITSDDDLGAHFSPYGALAEVRYPVFLLASRSFNCDEYPDRDILCYAIDVNRKSILVDAS